jgi:EAL domain-containing protein (putative c-di-GMP-specific phosphodiesterase class I)
MLVNRGIRPESGSSTDWAALPDISLTHAAQLLRLQGALGSTSLASAPGLPAPQADPAGLLHADQLLALQGIAAQVQGDLRAGLFRGEFHYEFQPMLRASSSEVFAYEGLLRWIRQGAVVQPARFLPFLEDSTLAGDIQDQLLGSVATVLALPGFAGAVSIDWSPVQFADHAGIAAFAARVLALGVDPARIIAEITDHSVFQRQPEAREGLVLLKDFGFQVALDGFGLGNLGLADLCNLPIDIVKVDGSLVRSLSDSPRARMVLGAIVDVAHRLGRIVVADGVESLDQLLGAVGLGCGVVQGCFVGAPERNSDCARPGAAILPRIRPASGSAGRP